MRERYGKHKYDIKKRPDNNELAAHCHEGHDVDQDLEIHILDYGIDHMEERKRREDKMICKLQTMGKDGLNELIGPCANAIMINLRDIYKNSNFSYLLFQFHRNY